jgi:NAD(P)H dehydrogenase (quinone)
MCPLCLFPLSGECCPGRGEKSVRIQLNGPPFGKAKTGGSVQGPGRDSAGRGLSEEIWLLNVSIILAHPNPKSFNHAIAGTAVARLQKNGHAALFHDLYAERFDPLLSFPEISIEAELPPDIGRHCDEIRSADGIIIVHPNWWGQPPAILKGWVDRVMRPGVAYKFLEDDQGEGIPVGLLKARAAIVFNTANTPPEREQEGKLLTGIFRLIQSLCNRRIKRGWAY